MNIKRLPKAKIATVIFDEFGIEVSPFNKKTYVRIGLKKVPAHAVLSEKEFEQEFGFSYYGNLNHALIPDIKTKMIEIIIDEIGNQKISKEEIEFSDEQCIIISSVKETHSKQMNVGFPCEACAYEEWEDY